MSSDIETIGYIIFAIFISYILYKILMKLLTKKHISYFNNMRQRLIEDCIINKPDNIEWLVSNYISLGFGKIVGWMPGSLAVKLKTIKVTDPKGKVKKKTLRKLDKATTEALEKGGYDLEKVHFFAIVTQWNDLKWWIFPFYRIPYVGPRINYVWNMRKKISIAVIPMSMIKEPKLKGNIFVDTYTLVTKYGGLLVPSNMTISDGDFKNFVEAEYLKEAKTDIMDRVGDLVDAHQEMVGSEDLLKGILKSGKVPKSGGENT